MSTTHQDATTGGPYIDEIFETLSDGERRAILDDLVGTGGELAVACLIERFRDREHASSRDADRYHIRLRHQHLPKMASAGIVYYDDDTEHVVLTEVGYRTNEVRQRAVDLLQKK